MNLSIRHTKNHRHREQTPGCPGRGGGEGWTGTSGRADANYYAQNGQTTRSYHTAVCCTAPTGNSIQCPVISHNGKEYGKESIYMHN